MNKRRITNVVSKTKLKKVADLVQKGEKQKPYNSCFCQDGMFSFVSPDSAFQFKLPALSSIPSSLYNTAGLFALFNFLDYGDYFYEIIDSDSVRNSKGTMKLSQIEGDYDVIDQLNNQESPICQYNLEILIVSLKQVVPFLNESDMNCSANLFADTIIATDKRAVVQVPCPQIANQAIKDIPLSTKSVKLLIAFLDLHLSLECHTVSMSVTENSVSFSTSQGYLSLSLISFGLVNLSTYVQLFDPNYMESQSLEIDFHSLKPMIDLIYKENKKGALSLKKESLDHLTVLSSLDKMIATSWQDNNPAFSFTCLSAYLFNSIKLFDFKGKEVESRLTKGSHFIISQKDQSLRVLFSLLI